MQSNSLMCRWWQLQAQRGHRQQPRGAASGPTTNHRLTLARRWHFLLCAGRGMQRGGRCHRRCLAAGRRPGRRSRRRLARHRRLLGRWWLLDKVVIRVELLLYGAMDRPRAIKSRHVGRHTWWRARHCAWRCALKLRAAGWRRPDGVVRPGRRHACGGGACREAGRPDSEELSSSESSDHSCLPFLPAALPFLACRGAAVCVRARTCVGSCAGSAGGSVGLAGCGHAQLWPGTAAAA